MNKNALRLAAWVEYEMQNWARWCWSGRWPGPLPAQHCASAERRYRAPSDMSAVTGCTLPPNATRAQIVQRAYDTAMHRLERRVAVAEYVRPEDFGRQYGRVGASRRLQVSLKTYEMALHNACFKVEKAFGG